MIPFEQVVHRIAVLPEQPRCDVIQITLAQCGIPLLF
jgi:hypothetical protein